MPQALAISKETENKSEVFSKTESCMRLFQLAKMKGKPGPDKVVHQLFKSLHDKGDMDIVEAAMKNRVGVFCTLVRELITGIDRGHSANRAFVLDNFGEGQSAILTDLLTCILETATTSSQRNKQFVKNTSGQDEQRIAELMAG